MLQVWPYAGVGPQLTGLLVRGEKGGMRALDNEFSQKGLNSEAIPGPWKF